MTAPAFLTRSRSRMGFLARRYPWHLTCLVMTAILATGLASRPVVVPSGTPVWVLPHSVSGGERLDVSALEQRLIPAAAAPADAWHPGDAAEGGEVVLAHDAAAGTIMTASLARSDTPEPGMVSVTIALASPLAATGLELGDPITLAVTTLDPTGAPSDPVTYDATFESTHESTLTVTTSRESAINLATLSPTARIGVVGG